MTTFTASEINACCADVYSHPAARFLLGDSLHPGGLDLTEELARRLGIGANHSVLDAGCGPGASALMLVEKFGCEVTGITLEESAVTELGHGARKRQLAHRVSAIQGDVAEIDLAAEAFDIAIAECVVSIFLRKHEALTNVRGGLKLGGRLGITDVTVEGAIPESLQGIFAMAGCVGGAVSLGEYVQLIEESGFRVDEAVPLPDVARDFLTSIRKKMMFAEIGAKLGKIPVSPDSIQSAKSVLANAEELVESGVLGYGLVVATRP